MNVKETVGNEFGRNWYSQEALQYDICGNIVPMSADTAFPIKGIHVPLVAGAFDPGNAPFTFPEDTKPEQILLDKEKNAK